MAQKAQFEIREKFSRKRSDPFNFSILDPDAGNKFVASSMRHFREKVANFAINFKNSLIRDKSFPKEYTRLVNNRQTLTEYDINLPGKIVYQAAAVGGLNTAVLDTFSYILQVSPVDTGLYKSTHAISHNGVFIAQTPEKLQSWLEGRNLKAGDILRIFSIVPYARKLERFGITGVDRKMKTRKVSIAQRKKNPDAYRNRERVLAPSGVYHRLAYNYARKRFEGSAKIDREMLTATSLGFNPQSFGRGTFSLRNNNEAREYLYPSLLIGIRGTQLSLVGGVN